MNNLTFPPYTSLCLKLVGSILIFLFFFDFAVLAIPPKLSDQQWVLRLVNTFVDRGFLPLAGMIFLIVGYWIDANFINSEKQTEKKKFSLDFKLPVFILASIMGLFFIILIPLTINSVRTISSRNLAELQKQVSEAERGIQNQFDQYNSLAQNEKSVKQIEQTLTQIDEILQSRKFQGQELNINQEQQLRQRRQRLAGGLELAQNPEALERQVNQWQSSLRTQQQQRENQVIMQGIKQGLRNGLGSLFLAIGYIIIGWFGLKQFIKPKNKTRTSTR